MPRNFKKGKFLLKCEQLIYKCSSMNIQQASQSLKQLRIRAQLTQHELAIQSGVAYGTLRRLESSGRGSLQDYLRLQEVLNETLQSRVTVQQATGSSSLLAHEEVTTRQRVRKPSKIQVTRVSQSSSPAPTHQISHKLGLDFPYDWSNPNMPEDTLIAKVLEKARFADVSRIFAHFGNERVAHIAQDFGIDLKSGVLGSLMPSIELGHAHYLAAHVSH
jgi:transcriptional regulator with XRE-family HTH domain